MSEYVPEITFTEFKKLKAREIKEMKSYEVYSDGELLFIAMIPHGDFIAKGYTIDNSRVLATKANANGGKDYEEVIGEKAGAGV
jgi:hypothetical protein